MHAAATSLYKNPSSLQNTIIENFVASSSFLFITTTSLLLLRSPLLCAFPCSLGFLRGLVP